MCKEYIGIDINSTAKIFYDWTENTTDNLYLNSFKQLVKNNNSFFEKSIDKIKSSRCYLRTNIQQGL